MILQPQTDAEILMTRRVMCQLRPHIALDQYLPTIRRMMQTDGYRLVAVVTDGDVRAVAGYRFMEMLYCGRILYVDDLNTDETHRSQGYGHQLIAWLKQEAKTQGCDQLHLDSGVQRQHTHRFYFRKGLTINAYHFWTAL